MAKKPAPTFVIPPAPAKTGAKGSSWQQFINRWSKKYPNLRANAPDIQAEAKLYHIDPIYFASVLLTESGANYNTKPSSAGAIGIGQIMPLHVGQPVPWDPTAVITLSDLHSPGFNLRYSAYYLAQQIGKYGYAHAYDQGYNPGYTGGGPQQFVTGWNPKYVYQAGPTSPAGKAGTQVPGGTAPSAVDNTNPWVVLTKKGFAYVSGTNPPANVVTFGGTPLTRSDFNSAWNQGLRSTYEAYTGKPANAHQIANILAQGIDATTLATQLATQPSFQKSPVWKKSAPGLIALGRSILGQNWQPSGGIIQQAIAQNWDQATFEAKIRQLPAYEQGPEFKTNFAQNQSAFSSVFGSESTNDPTIMAMIKQKTKAGWTPDQISQWAMQQPAYKNSPAYAAKHLSLMSQLGLITGSQASLSLDQINTILGSADKIALAQPGAAGAAPTPGANGAPPPNPIPPTGQSGYAQASNANLH